MCERDRWRQGDKDRHILTHNFFSWPYHAVLSSRPHLELLLLLCHGVLNQGPTVGRCSSGVLSVTTSWDSKTATDSRALLYISFRNNYTFLINHVTASAYFHKCILFREYLIDSSVKGQYVTQLNFLDELITEDWYIRVIQILQIVLLRFWI